jgi:hypothetical protein
MKKGEITLSKLQKLQKELYEVRSLLNNYYTEHNKLHEQIYRRDCMKIKHNQLIKLMLNDDWCEHIDKVRGISWHPRMENKIWDNFPQIDIKGPVLNDTVEYRYASVFLVHDGYVWFCKDLASAYSSVEMIVKFNTTDWQIEDLEDRRHELSMELKELKKKIKPNNVKQLHVRKKAVA